MAATASLGQSFNLDFGEPDAGPSPTYAAAGVAGVWNPIRAHHGTTTSELVDIQGQPSSVSLTQIGGLETLFFDDPATSGDDASLMDDYLVTFDAGLESCIFMDGLDEGLYEVLIYARMPDQPVVQSDTFVDQEEGIPHFQVGGPWPGGHEELVTFSRHIAYVGPDGNLDFHSGIAPSGAPLEGAALNGAQVRRITAFFSDGFESGGTLALE